MVKHKMIKHKVSCVLLSLAIAAGVACNEKSQAPDVKANVEQALNQAGLKDVNVSQDRDKGIVTLGGTVATDDQKAQAASIAQPIAGSEVLANQIAVRPPNDKSDARIIDSDLDKSIDKNVDAKLVQMRLQHAVKHDVKNGVVTLKGEVTSQSRREIVEKTVAGLPNVKQVVNELEVKNQKATSTPGS
jgi:hyperosmotically inducible periplasmic protein